MASTSNSRAIAAALAFSGLNLATLAGNYVITAGAVDELTANTVTYQRAQAADENAIKAAATKAAAGPALDCYPYGNKTRCRDTAYGGQADFEIPVEASAVIIVDGQVFTKPEDDGARSAQAEAGGK